MCSVGWEWAENIQLIGSGSDAAAAAKTEVSILSKKKRKDCRYIEKLIYDDVCEKIYIHTLCIVSQYKYVGRCC